MPLVRLQKFLSEAGVCSRRHGEDLIRAGRVSVNGEVVTVLGAKIDPARDRVTVDGQPLRPLQHLVYIALHKPRGYVTSCRHSGKKIVLDLVNVPERIYPVGRLDKDSTGLLILTNDGRLHLKLSHPSFDHEKEYDVALERPISDGALRRMAAGLPILDTRTRPAQVTRTGERAFRIVLKEGRNRQIRRMVRRLGNEVVALKRIRMGSVRLGRLAEGSWRYLSAEEVAQLLEDPVMRPNNGASPSRSGDQEGSDDVPAQMPGLAAKKIDLSE
jgi:23S rRNA pseudouridine2605 synthase/23S rRNA pseudouridine2604 synthase